MGKKKNPPGSPENPSETTGGKRYLVETPNPSFEGVRDGVRFKQGRAIVHSLSIAKAFENNWGYSYKLLKKGEVS